MSKTFVITEKLNKIFEKKNLSSYKLAKIIDYPDSSLCSMIKANRPFSNKVIEKILPILEVSKEEFTSWIVADKYSKEVLVLAIEAKKAHKTKKLILTTKIDEILKIKKLSRTALSKQINHSQSGLNRVITGKEPLSKNLMNKISTALEIPVEYLQAWVLADKYSAKVLEYALESLD